MDKAYKQISYLFIGLLVVTLIGFFKTYFGLFPQFTGSVNAHHFHAFTLLLWLALLIAQPLLIRFKQLEWHRLVGKASYLLAPLVVFSILLVTRVQYQRGVAQHLPSQWIYYGMYMSFVDLVPFITLYWLAMRYRKVPSVHMRYIIACSVIFFNPAFGRINVMYLGLDLVPGVLWSYVYCDLILVGFLIYDVVKRRPYRPYAYSLAFLLICHSSLLYAPFTQAWQWTAEAVAKKIF